MPKRSEQDVRAEPVTHPLIGIARDLHTQMVSRLRDEHGHAGLRPSLGPFLSLVWVEPRPLTLIAERLAISKQGASQLARLADTSGYLERAIEGADARGKRVGLSPRGRRLVADAIRIMRESEADYVEQVGAAPFRRFAAACDALYVAMGVHPRLEGSADEAVRPALGGLPQLALEIQSRLITSTSALGHRGLKLSQAQILPRIGPAGMRVRDLSIRHGISRQAVSVTCRELEGLGYLQRAPDPGDQRGAILRLTRRGERLLADSIEASRALEREFAAILGEDGFRDLRETAHALFRPMRESGPEFAAASAAIGSFGLRALEGGDDRNDRAERGDRIERVEFAELDALAKKLRRTLGPRNASRLGRLLRAEGDSRRADRVARPATRSRA